MAEEKKKPFHTFLGSLREYEKFIGSRCEIVDTGESDIDIKMDKETMESERIPSNEKTRKFIEDNQVIAIVQCTYSPDGGLWGIPVRKKVKLPKK